MLTNKALHEEIKKADDFIADQVHETTDTYTLKMMTLILKMLSSIRTNQVRVMEKMGVEKLKSNKFTADE